MLDQCRGANRPSRDTDSAIEPVLLVTNDSFPEAMKAGAPGSFGAQLKALREPAGFTQEELATIAGLIE